MSRVRVVTDSTVRFATPGFLARHPVAIAPLTLRCHLDAWEESPDDEIDSVRSPVERWQGYPVAEPPSTERMAEAYGQLALETDQIVSIHASAHINPTVHNAQAASQKFLGRCSIQVVDSQTLSSGLGLLVEAAGRVGRGGAWRGGKAAVPPRAPRAARAASPRACTGWSSPPPRYGRGTMPRTMR